MFEIEIESSWLHECFVHLALLSRALVLVLALVKALVLALATSPSPLGRSIQKFREGMT